MDATEPNLRAGFLPFRCLNGEGHLMAGPGSQTVSLVNPKSIENTTVQIELKDGKMNGMVRKDLSGLSAFDLRESIKSDGGKEEHFNKLKNNSAGIDYLECRYNNLDSLDKPVQINYKIAIKQSQDNNAGIMYIDPIIIDRIKVNPFKSPERVYPVDYGVSFIKLYNLQLTISRRFYSRRTPAIKDFCSSTKGRNFRIPGY